MKEYIRLKSSSKNKRRIHPACWLSMNLRDRLALLETPEAKQVLVDVYQELGLYASAYTLFSELVDKSDRKQVKKLFTLERWVQSWRSLCSPSSFTEKRKKEAHKEKVSELPTFRYHPDPLATGAFKEGEPKTCPSCGEDHTIYYALETLLWRAKTSLSNLYLYWSCCPKSLKQSLSKMLIGKGSWIRKRPGPLQSNSRL